VGVGRAVGVSVSMSMGVRVTVKEEGVNVGGRMASRLHSTPEKQ
jgi:predicted NAD/FAD-dependent oxidoreductase